MSETDEQFLDSMEQWVIGSLVFKREHRERLFTLARRGAGLTLDRQRHVVREDHSHWIMETYSRYVPIPPPPAGEQR